MKAVRRRPAARWLPSRFRFASFRLYAFVRLVTTRERDCEDDVVLVIDRDQSFDQCVVAGWIFATSALELAAALPLHPLLATLLAALCAPLLLQLPLFLTGGVLLTRHGNNMPLNGAMTMSLVAIASAATLRANNWAGVVAWLFFAVLTVNAFAAVICMALGPRFARAERELAPS